MERIPLPVLLSQKWALLAYCLWGVVASPLIDACLTPSFFFHVIYSRELASSPRNNDSADCGFYNIETPMTVLSLDTGVAL